MRSAAKAPAQPFVKWAGGKGKEAEGIVSLLPDQIGTYYEPFLGGGAVFFALARETPRRFQRAVLGDRAGPLIETYTVVKHKVGPLIAVLTRHARRYADDGEAYYYHVRDELDVDELDMVHRAARFIFLLKTGFNGLYRVNQKGEFNVPHGRPARDGAEVRICDSEKLRATSHALVGARAALVSADFEEVIGEAKTGDAVYFDPPYVGAFDGYTKERFTEFDHRRLKAAYHWLHARGVAAVLSSSDTAKARRIYDGLELVKVKGHRALAREGSAKDLLIVGIR